MHVGKPAAPDDRQALERLIRYGARPAFAQSRLSITAAGNVSYKLKRPWHTGQTHITLSPLAFLRRLTTLIPPPRSHLIRYHGAFASRSHMRPWLAALVPANRAEPTTLPHDAPPSAEPIATGTPPSDPADAANEPAAKSKSYTWAKLLARVFQIDVTRCSDPACRGPVKIIAWITQPDVIDKILNHLGIAARAPPPLPLDTPPQTEFEFLAHAP